ncbi:TetR/AcrR family transcriptional regulator [Mycobacterium riyadhense]|uniref:Bacterial regulatory proteins, tetR family n=1 Tax=Mycobacterium riyadhense TaxID=486698 RepID=A0A653EJA4_9MYCO|nr:TetR/AcrR family transcriptional regulator [Mycobacterium riyadhense]VTO97644.1 Bacterial regulatory proteins, tetR family [Mycobacterium riyadhense]
MATRRKSSWLTVDDWLQAGYALLSEEGLNALKLDRLTARLDVTKGSFYWHFANMAAYRRALIDTWAQLRDEDRRDVERMGEVPPRERLLRMAEMLLRSRLWKLELAMREWARSDKTVAAAVRSADRRLLNAMKQAYRDYGFEDEEADVRATTAFAAGIGMLNLAGPTPTKQAALQLEQFINFTLRP